MQTISLTEYQTTYLPETELSTAVGTRLWQQYDRNGSKLRVEFPSPKTNQRWALTPQGWVGHIPVSPDLALTINPKVPLRNLFALWAVAHRLHGVDWLDGLTNVESMPAFYEFLAARLTAQVQRRIRRGLYRAYRRENGPLPVVRGRLHPQRQPQTAPLLTCSYDEQTRDLPENQILAAALGVIARSGRCRPALQREVRAAARVLGQVADGTAVTPAALPTIHYHRLNADYAPLHALSRFFLAQEGPQQSAGDAQLPAFLIDMAQLFEQFVAVWLTEQLPDGWRLQVQEHLVLGEAAGLRMAVDLVLYDRDGRLHAVLDTKYKAGAQPTAADVQQIIAYAHLKRARRAILIYPGSPPPPQTIELPDLTLRVLPFALAQPLPEAGAAFLSSLLDMA